MLRQLSGIVMLVAFNMASAIDYHLLVPNSTVYDFIWSAQRGFT